MYEIKPHGAYIAIWQDGQRIAKIPMKTPISANDRYGLLPDQALAMAQRIVEALEKADASCLAQTPGP